MELAVIILASLVAGAAWSSPLRGLAAAAVRPLFGRFSRNTSGHDRILRFSQARAESAPLPPTEPRVEATEPPVAMDADASRPAPDDARPPTDIYRGDDRPAVWRVDSQTEAGHLRSAIVVGDLWVRLDGELDWESTAARRRVLARAVADHPRWSDEAVDDLARKLGLQQVPDSASTADRSVGPRPVNERGARHPEDDPLEAASGAS